MPAGVCALLSSHSSLSHSITPFLFLPLLLLLPFSSADYPAGAPLPVGADCHFQLPTTDLAAPDLYLPMMAFVTYVLLRGYSSGLSGAFHPELLSTFASAAFVTLFLEVLITKSTLYLVGATSSSSSSSSSSAGAGTGAGAGAGGGVSSGAVSGAGPLPATSSVYSPALLEITSYAGYKVRTNMIAGIYLFYFIFLLHAWQEYAAIH